MRAKITKLVCGDSWETLTEGHGSLELLNRAGSERAGTQFVLSLVLRELALSLSLNSREAGTQFVLSPRHATVVSCAIFGGENKRASQLISK